MLQLTNVCTPLITDVSLKVALGQIIAITGNNGSGKSSLAKAIAGHMEIDSGEINLDPTEIGLLTQNPFLQFIGYTVFDELTYSLEQQNATHAKINQVLAQSPIKLTRELSKLSGGQAQQLLIFKEMMSDKRVLILDETLSNLDEVNKAQIIDKLKASGKAIILITNNLNDTKYADASYQITEGKLQQVTQNIVDEHLLDNTRQVAFNFNGYQFKYGLNLVTGDSNAGKSTLVNNLCFELKTNISLIPQYPFEMITTVDASHLQTSRFTEVIGLSGGHYLQNITELSTGELVKVQLIEALESGNKILVLDESIEVLDYDSQVSVLDLISTHFETVIIITHNRYLFNDRHVHVLEVQ
ncbi:ATP-binding cassette domain-containing protein [Mollicutes bacterium LVI A0039]|nr:ATP-binding cassette domain-containing protein [Mollicutes bacterium LVI A0039]